MEKLCLCGSEIPYNECCRPLHKGKSAPTPLALMRSRYSAYALNLPKYIVETTHPASPQFQIDHSSWIQSIAKFCQNTQFEGLKIVESEENGPLGMVLFEAKLRQKDQLYSLIEKSYFEKFQGNWFYRLGSILKSIPKNTSDHSFQDILPLAYYGEEVLRKKATPIHEISSEIKTLAKQMIATMDACDGIGLAAPQVHRSVQMFVIRNPVEHSDGSVDFQGPRVFLNPKISNPSEKTWSHDEGCLSIPAIQARVKRPVEVQIEYMDLQGKTHTETISGWKARVVLHEYDHLQGVLFFDYLDAKDKKKIQPLLDSLKKRLRKE